MISTMLFPNNQGLIIHSNITENEESGSVKVKVVEFSINGETASGLSRAKTFKMEIGDIIYITPSGLVLVTHDEDGNEVNYPDSSNRFSNGSIYWLLSRISEDSYNKLETEEA